MIYLFDHTAVDGFGDGRTSCCQGAGVTNLLNPARNLDAILGALRSSGERERDQEFINPNMLWEGSGNGLGNGLGMVSKSGVSVPSTRPLKGLVAMTYSGNEMYTSPMMIMMA